MERLVGGDDFGFVFLSLIDKETPCQFDSAFVGFRPAVAEKNFAAETQAGDFRRELCLRFDMKPVGDMEQLPGLFADRPNHLGMAMPEVVNRHAGEEVEVFVSRRVPDMHALAFNQSDRIAAVGGGDVALGQLHDFPVHRSLIQSDRGDRPGL